MALGVAAQLQMGESELQTLKQELAEKLKTASRYEDAADLLDPAADFENSLTCYLKANAFEKAVKLCLQQNRPFIVDQQVKPSVSIAYELKSNQLRLILEQYSKRLLRLRIVQNTKRSMPVSNLGGDFELDSEQLSVSQASESNRSRSQSGFSETSKKSRKQQNAGKKMRKQRAVKEGSPFEEEYLIELIKEETCLQHTDKETVSSLMKILMFLGMVSEATELHSLVEKVILARSESSKLLSVEQERLLKDNFNIKEVFSNFLGYGEQQLNTQKRELAEWQNLKSFKH